MRVRYRTIRLPFHYPFTISKGTKTHQTIFQVELEWNGIRGYGEAPEISYYNIPAETMASDLEQKKAVVEKFALTVPDRFWHFLHHLFPKNNFLVCALDMAAWDLYGKLQRKPLYELFRADPTQMPVTDYTIGIDSADLMIEKMLKNPWPVYKIKVGTEGDIERLDALRQSTTAVLRVDANAGWSLNEARDKIPYLEKSGVELIEQPLATGAIEEMKILFGESTIPLFADESCVKEQDVPACAGLFHGINIKLTKCSGITPARRMISEAKSKGMKVMIGCMNESWLGTTAIGHLGPLVDYLDADGPLLLNDTSIQGHGYKDHRIQLTGKPGLGIDMPEFE